MIRTFLYNGDVKLTFCLDGDNSYCLIDGEEMANTYNQTTYEIWIRDNSDKLTEVTELCKMEVKKHSMTE
jgi:hypothetical protein